MWIVNTNGIRFSSLFLFLFVVLFCYFLCLKLEQFLSSNQLTFIALQRFPQGEGHSLIQTCRLYRHVWRGTSIKCFLLMRRSGERKVRWEQYTCTAHSQIMVEPNVCITNSVFFVAQMMISTWFASTDRFGAESFVLEVNGLEQYLFGSVQSKRSWKHASAHTFYILFPMDSEWFVLWGKGHHSFWNIQFNSSINRMAFSNFKSWTTLRHHCRHCCTFASIGIAFRCKIYT